jgi:5-formyltetrahydrofolate cyclo-ligase
MNEKRSMRAWMKSVVTEVSEEDRDRWSSGITGHLTALPEWHRCRTVLAFLPMKIEVDTRGIIARSLAEGKTVGVPRMYGEEIKFHKIDSIDGPWDCHPYGIDEPPLSLPEIDLSSIDYGNICVITPGLCFDREGQRLGFGKGCYDRFNLHCSKVAAGRAFFAGICFNIQLVDLVPVSEFDRRLDAVVTESGVVYRRYR